MGSGSHDMNVEIDFNITVVITVADAIIFVIDVVVAVVVVIDCVEVVDRAALY